MNEDQKSTFYTNNEWYLFVSKKTTNIKIVNYSFKFETETNSSNDWTLASWTMLDDTGAN